MRCEVCEVEHVQKSDSVSVRVSVSLSLSMKVSVSVCKKGGRV